MSNLIVHAGAARLSLDDLKALPEPKRLGSSHAPVPHSLLVESIEVEAMERGYDVTKMELAVSKDRSQLFGVLDLVPPDGLHTLDRGISIGFRNSTDSTLAIKIVAGTRVFVCDNLALSGDLIAVLRRNTVGLDLGMELREGFSKFIQHSTTLEVKISILQSVTVADMAAKAQIFDIFNSKIMPVRLFDDVSQFYFQPTDEMTDCHPRTLWGLHNAFTRAMKKLPAAGAFAANVALGRAFGMTSAS
ncbi:MAG: hypothetical protein ACHQX3_00485 [Nitrospirales bacterium]